MIRQALHEVRPSAAQREGNLLAFRAERCRHAPARFADRLRKAHRCGREIAREGFVRADDRGTHLFGIDDDLFALLRQAVDQRADAPLVIRVRALEVRDLRAHHGFELARAGERALDPVAKRGDFAADRLRQRHDLLGRDRLRFGKPDRDFRHRSRGHAHLVGAARHERGHKHEDDRPEDTERDDAQFRPPVERHAIGRHEKLAVAGKIGRADAGPDDRQKQRGNERCRTWANPHRLQDGADRLPVLVRRRNGGCERRVAASGPRRYGGLADDGGGRRMLAHTFGQVRRAPIVDRGRACLRQLHAGGKRRLAFSLRTGGFGGTTGGLICGSLFLRGRIAEVQRLFDCRQCRCRGVLGPARCGHCKPPLALRLSSSFDARTSDDGRRPPRGAEVNQTLLYR